MTSPDPTPATEEAQVEAHAGAALDLPPESPLDPDYDLVFPMRDSSLPRLNSMEFGSEGSSRALETDIFLQDSSCLPVGGDRSPPQSPLQRSSSPGGGLEQLAVAALRHLPVPLVVIDGRRTISVANTELGRLLGILPKVSSDSQAFATMEGFTGLKLHDLGINILHDDRHRWGVRDWDDFFDKLLLENGFLVRGTSGHSTSSANGDTVPLLVDGAASPDRLPRLNRKNAVIEVAISCKNTGTLSHFGFVKVTVTVWEAGDGNMCFTLSFPNESVPHGSSPTDADQGDTSDATDAAKRNPKSDSLSFSQKIDLMKDAVLDSMRGPAIAIWKDQSVIFPNRFAKGLMHQDVDSQGSLHKPLNVHWELWTEDFSRLVELREWPLYEVLETKKPVAGKRFGIYGADGKKTIIMVSSETIRDKVTNEFLAALCYGQDFTGVRDEIDEIKERENARMRAVCESLPQLVWTATPDGYSDFFNNKWYQYTGLSVEDSIGKMCPDVMHRDEEHVFMEGWTNSIATGEPFQMEYRCRGRNGDFRWFLLRVAAIRDKHSNRIEKWFGTCTDIHEMKLANLNIKRTRLQLLSVIAHSQVTIFTVDPERRVTMLEGALIWNMTKGSVDEGSRWFDGEDMYVVFNRLTKQLPEGERPRWLQPIEDILNGRVREKGKEIVKEHGLDNRWYRTRFIPMINKRCPKSTKDTSSDGSRIEGVIGVIMDITELKIKGEALREQSREKHRAMASAAAAKEATRLKSQFLANMSHEIRTPIAGVLGMAELLGDTQLNEGQRDYVTNIQSCATSLLTVINDILDFSKVESGQLDIEQVQFSLSRVIGEVERMIHFSVGRKELNFHADIASDIANDLVVIGDPGRLRQVILNLLTNSIKFTNQGYVRFSVIKEKETAETIEVKFVVEDSGIGIEEETHRKLFKPFYQGDASTARRFGGTGLGLTISKNLVELMNGGITLDSTYGRGTTATFWIPFLKPTESRKMSMSLVSSGRMPDRPHLEPILSRSTSDLDRFSHFSSVQWGPSPSARGSSLPARAAPTQPALPPEQELPFSRRSRMHILVVDDNPVNQKIAATIIGKLGFQVSAIWNGKEALNYMLGVMQGNNVRPDMILMDVQMPIIDGYKCTHLLRHHLPYKSLVHDVPIVAVTASAIQGDREKCTKAGMDDYLAKPVTMKILEQMLIKWCLSRRNSSQSELSSTDCSGGGEHCDHAHIPQLNFEPEAVPRPANDDDFFGSPKTTRPFTPLNQRARTPTHDQTMERNANAGSLPLQDPFGREWRANPFRERKLSDMDPEAQEPPRRASFLIPESGDPGGEGHDMVTLSGGGDQAPL